MPLNTVTTGNTILASDVNQLVYVLQRQTGQSESGKYWDGGWSSASNDLLSTYYSSLNRNSVPVSVSVDALDQNAQVSAISTDHLTSNGVHLYCFSNNGAQLSCNAAGNVTLNF